MGGCPFQPFTHLQNWELRCRFHFPLLPGTWIFKQHHTLNPKLLGSFLCENLSYRIEIKEHLHIWFLTSTGPYHVQNWVPVISDARLCALGQSLLKGEFLTPIKCKKSLFKQNKTNDSWIGQLPEPGQTQNSSQQCDLTALIENQKAQKTTSLATASSINQ